MGWRYTKVKESEVGVAGEEKEEEGRREEVEDDDDVASLRRSKNHPPSSPPAVHLSPAQSIEASYSTRE